MWTHHNPYQSDPRFHKKPPTEEDRLAAMEYFREKAERMQHFKVINVK